MPREITHEHTPAPEQIPENSDDMARLLRLALDKVAFLPFGLLVDRGDGRCSAAKHFLTGTSGSGGNSWRSMKQWLDAQNEGQPCGW